MMNFVTKWFSRQEKNIDNEDGARETDPIEAPELEFKSFWETYKYISLALSLGMMYPNKRTTKIRFFIIVLLLVSIMPVSGIIFIDMYRYYVDRDYIEIIRHSTIVGPFLGCFLKMFLVLFQEGAAIEILKEIDRDYSLYNRASSEFKEIVRRSIRNNLIYSERCWAITVFTTVLTFPIMAAVLTVYNQLFKSDPEKYMVHEMNPPFYKDPHERQESPYYEIMFIYTLYCAYLYAINFLGYDGFYGLAINHACLKIDMYCKAMEEAMRFPSVSEIRARVVWVIMEQNRSFKYMENIQKFFNIWLGIIFLATMIQLCNLLYHISEGYGFDLRYMIFISGVIIHIFLPCHYSAKLKSKCAETSNLFYCCGWERVNDDDLRRIICFMIARAQIPHEITAFNMLTFDMELFVSIMQTSYSMYTLLLS